MKLDDQLKLSFYKEVADVDKKHGVSLVQHVDTGKIYVRKNLMHYDREVFEFIKQGRFQGVPVIHDLIEHDNTLVVIEDYISGRSLSEILDTKNFEAQEATEIITRLCDILKPFHSHNPPIIHRDIKAANVIIDNESKVYLIDFDASKRVTEGKKRDTELIGTEEYAAPEQYGFGQSDQRTDIYALGVLLNKMLTGKLPSEEKHDGFYADIINRAIEIDPDNRYQNVVELAEALKSGDFIATNVVIEDVSDVNDANGISDENDSSDMKSEDRISQSGPLLGILKHLPYPIRELPGFRSGRIVFFIAALLWYMLLISFGFFGINKNPQYTAEQNRFYDFATFAVLLTPTLYLGNYLNIRDRLPWRNSGSKAGEAVRICLGAFISVGAVFLILTVLAIVFNI